jgi:hypothetical protein
MAAPKPHEPEPTIATLCNSNMRNYSYDRKDYVTVLFCRL